nr:hypothetical protein [Tanacetum cinerariifolium]
MLDRTDFASWQQRIRLYYRGKDNGFGPERPHVYSDLNSNERVGTMSISGPPIYCSKGCQKTYTPSSITTSMQKTSGIMQHKEESINDYYVRFSKLINDMRNIKMTMPKLQLNSKFVNNMLPEWARFVTVVKMNRGLRESNYDQLFSYLKKHEAHAKENKMVLERLSQPIAQPTSDPLTLLSNVSNTQHGSPSSSTSSITPVTPPRSNSTNDLIENLTSTLALLI